MEQHVYSWGWGGFGQLGHNSQSDVLEPTRISEPWGPEVHPVKFGGGEWHSAVVLSDGSAYTCGYGRHGAIAQGHTSSVLTFSKVKLNDFIVDVSCGQTHTVFLTRTGKVYACGWSGYGQLGLGDTDYYVHPTIVPIGSADVIRVATRGHLTYFLTSDGKVFRTGFSEHIGGRKLSPKLIGTLPFRASDCIVFECPATRVPEGPRWGDILVVSAAGDVYTRVAAGSGGGDKAKFVPSDFYRDICKKYRSSIQTATLTFDQALILLHNGTLLRLNPGTVTPVEMGDGGYEQVVCGNRHIMALHSSGHVHVWGRNDKGQHGLGHTKPVESRANPHSIVPFPGQTDLAIRTLFAGPDYNFVVANPVDSLHHALSKVCDSEAYTDLTLAVKSPARGMYTRRVHSSIVTATQPRLFTLLTDRASAGIASNGDDQDWVHVPGQALDKDDGDGCDVVTKDDVWLLSPDVDVDDEMVEKFVKMLYGHYLSSLSEEQLGQVGALCRAANITPIQLACQHTRLFESPVVMRQHARALYNNIEGSDVTLIVEQEGSDDDDDTGDGDGRDRDVDRKTTTEQVIIRAHRYLLSARSPYFAGMFRAGARFNEGNSSEIVLPATFGVESTLNVIRFIYGTPMAEMDLEPDVAFGMLQAGLYLLITDVTTDTDLLDVIHRGFDVENIVYIHTLARDNELTWLQHRCQEYIVIHHDQLHKHESYATLSAETRSVVESRVKTRERSHQLRLQERMARRKKKKGKGAASSNDDDTDTDTDTEYNTDSDDPSDMEVQTSQIKGKSKVKTVPKKKKRKKEGKGHRGKKKVNLGLGLQHIFGMFKRWGRGRRNTGESSGNNS